ncbi:MULTISPECIES: hypothetical protein [unclassified Streptomyces]|uniref:hypothetical protein n=1 Tax=unclassified Streptomyces TaxID=2593676 RepID=UPI002DD88B55|nr:hypothetical protein [Streptomyces sp. NBC_01795]WSA97776.1 hypothetical protein OIE63_40530 [Streptomyces sp. NBC_01795]WSS46707.1 hypothetical protein OG220_39690 [Streptomyces sp. NBC_01187]WSS47076.1 hypothetical protein OG220_41935 [Streptomyces sp. NBC_01187]
MTGTKLTTEQITVTLDIWERPVVVLPDDVAARLSVSSRDGLRDYGYCHVESRQFDADTFETCAVRTILEAVQAAYPAELGLSQYRLFNVGSFYGWIIGASGWDTAARTWTDYDAHRHLTVRGAHLHHDGRSHFGD